MKVFASIFLNSLLTASAWLGQAVEPVANVKLKFISDQLSLPTAFAVAPGGADNQLFVCEQEGRIRILDNGKLLP